MSFFQVGRSPIMTIKSQILALKYRPQIFKDLIEHEEIAKNEISENTPFLNAFKKVVKVGCKIAINISEKI